MTSDLLDIEYYYKEGLSAYNEYNFKVAARMFKKCHHIYQNADLPFFSFRIKNMGEDAFEKYCQITKKHLNGDDFDDIEL